MLILSRTIDQAIDITSATGEVINLKVTKIRGRLVKIGITAPASFSIARSELLPNEKQAAQRSAEQPVNCVSQ